MLLIGVALPGESHHLLVQLIESTLRTYQRTASAFFYTRSGTAFGRNGQAEVVEIFSIRHLALVRALTFGFGDGRNIRNPQLLPQLRTHGTIYMQIETSGFGDEESSPALIASSFSQLHWNFVGLDPIRERNYTSISSDA